MHRRRDADTGAPERRLAAAVKQLRIVREDVEEAGVERRVAAATDEVEAARELLE